MAILSPGRHHLSEKQPVIQTGKAIKSGRGIGKGARRHGASGGQERRKHPGETKKQLLLSKQVVAPLPLKKRAPSGRAIRSYGITIRRGMMRLWKQFFPRCGAPRHSHAFWRYCSMRLIASSLSRSYLSALEPAVKAFIARCYVVSRQGSSAAAR